MPLPSSSGAAPASTTTPARRCGPCPLWMMTLRSRRGSARARTMTPWPSLSRIRLLLSVTRAPARRSTPASRAPEISRPSTAMVAASASRPMASGWPGPAPMTKPLRRASVTPRAVTAVQSPAAPTGGLRRLSREPTSCTPDFSVTASRYSPGPTVTVSPAAAFANASPMFEKSADGSRPTTQVRGPVTSGARDQRRCGSQPNVRAATTPPAPRRRPATRPRPAYHQRVPPDRDPVGRAAAGGTATGRREAPVTGSLAEAAGAPARRGPRGVTAPAKRSPSTITTVTLSLPPASLAAVRSSCTASAGDPAKASTMRRIDPDDT